MAPDSSRHGHSSPSRLDERSDFESLYDQPYVAKHAQGFDQLAAHVREFTPEWAETITELPAAQIRDTARAMGQAKPAVVVHPGRHVTWYGDDTQRARAMAILTALLGSWGRKGGLFLLTPSRRAVSSYRTFQSHSADARTAPAAGFRSPPRSWA